MAKTKKEALIYPFYSQLKSINIEILLYFNYYRNRDQFYLKKNCRKSNDVYEFNAGVLPRLIICHFTRNLVLNSPSTKTQLLSIRHCTKYCRGQFPIFSRIYLLGTNTVSSSLEKRDLDFINGYFQVLMDSFITKMKVQLLQDMKQVGFPNMCII